MIATKKGENGGVAAVDRALTILEAFSNNAPSLSLGEIAARTGFYKSTILRLIQSMERFDFIVRGQDSRYRVGPACWRLGVLFKQGLRLEDRLMPFLSELSDVTKETVAFWIPVTGQSQPVRLCMMRVESPYEVSHNFRIGDALSLSPPRDEQLGTTGRVLRAYLFPTHPEDDGIRAERVFSSYGIRDPEVLGVAAPVFGLDGELVGGLILSAPTSRRDREWAQSMKPLVLATADRATLALGGTVP